MNLFPIPSDALVGMYHPWRDFFGNLPFKNFILTDPVRQQYPWRELVISLFKDHQWPLWNPYSFAGTPLLANIQSAVFYPLNILFFIFNFPIVWSIYIYSAWVLGFLFMFLYLKNLNLSKIAAIFGSLCFVLSGFFTAWLENGVLTHTLLWLPLILWSIDRQKSFFFLLSSFFSFTAGHWQIFFYVFVFANIYAFVKHPKQILKYLILNSFFLLLTLPQLLPSLEFISLSARTTDQVWVTNPGWFIPWQNLVQFISPDFFGNPSTLNYRGVFSYQEFVGYVGISALISAFSALFIRRRIIWFFVGAVALGLLFALPTSLAKLPFLLDLPLISSSMPTRLLSVVGFSLAVLAAFGVQKINIGAFWVFGGTLLILWIFWPTKYLIIPTGLLVTTFLFRKYPQILVLVLLADLGFFVYKFLPFTDQKYLYPNTKVIQFLQENTKSDHSRFMTLNDEIFPPNSNIIYRLQSINGYDPLYLKSYQELVGGGNRIIVPKDYRNPIINKLGVKYVLSFEDISSPDYQLVFEEGKTKVFENKKTWPRTFFTDFSGKAVITSYRENEVIIQTKNPVSKELILTDAFYPTWKVTIDSQKAEIARNDNFFRQVFVPAGYHTVRFYQ
jgi:hypothetical protein